MSHVSENETIIISLDEYDILRDESDQLLFLRQFGVDNWEGYGEAMHAYNQYIEDLERIGGA